jgi:hypothetical protein
MDPVDGKAKSFALGVRCTGRYLKLVFLRYKQNALELSLSVEQPGIVEHGKQSSFQRDLN